MNVEYMFLFGFFNVDGVGHRQSIVYIIQQFHNSFQFLLIIG
jgi:hypothetical protein